MTYKVTCNSFKKGFEYEIDIGSGLFQQMELLEGMLRANRYHCVIISDEYVADLYGEALLTRLQSSYLEATLLPFPRGEGSKTREMKQRLEDAMLQRRLGRDSCVIALGGGVTLDLAGYIAATYCRGIPLIMIPTSLLGMVDAAIGGKVGVNAQMYKNMIGAVYPPKYVLIDPSFLRSLEVKECMNGIVEMVKHALIADESYFSFLEGTIESLLAKDAFVLERAIHMSCKIKRSVVEEDLCEEGKRRILNFGHTVGHALEALTAYEISHGRAVAIGMLLEGYISMQMGHLSELSLQRMCALLQNLGIDLEPPLNLTAPELLAGMGLDKKALNGMPRIVVLEKIGQAHPCGGKYCKEIDLIALQQALAWVTDALCCH